MKIMCDTDEFWPVFTLSKADGKWPDDEFDFPDDLFDRYEAAMKEFDTVQKLIREVTDK